MPIKIDGKVSIDAPREEVWNSLLDLDILKKTAAHVPGVDVERLDQIDEMHYEGTATIGVAAVKGKYSGTITILDKKPVEYMRLKGEGKGGGNWTNGEISMTLTEDADKTLMSFVGQGNLSGPLASVGQRLVDTVGRQLIDQGTRFLAEEISARHRAKLDAGGAAAARGTAAGSEMAVQSAPASTTLASQAASAAMPQSSQTGAVFSRGISMRAIALVILALGIIALVAYLSITR